MSHAYGGATLAALNALIDAGPLTREEVQQRVHASRATTYKALGRLVEIGAAARQVRGGVVRWVCEDPEGAHALMALGRRERVNTSAPRAEPPKALHPAWSAMRGDTYLPLRACI